MLEYKVTFFFDRGVTLVMDFRYDSKGQQNGNFDTTMHEIATRLGAFTFQVE